MYEQTSNLHSTIHWLRDDITNPLVYTAMPHSSGHIDLHRTQESHPQLPQLIQTMESWTMVFLLNNKRRINMHMLAICIHTREDSRHHISECKVTFVAPDSRRHSSDNRGNTIRQNPRLPKIAWLLKGHVWPPVSSIYSYLPNRCSSQKASQLNSAGGYSKQHPIC